MSTLALSADERVANVKFTNSFLCVSLADGRVISVPLRWYPRLLKANSKQRANWELCGAPAPLS